MGVIRFERNKNYTHMANYHLRDKSLSLRAVGLMSKMLSLKDDWSYSVAGLAGICKEGREAVRNVLKELEAAGYLTRDQHRSGGRFSGYDYTLREFPEGRDPDRCPDFWATDDPPLPRIPVPKNPPQLNTEDQVTPYSPPEGDVPSDGSRRRTARKEPKAAPDWKPERFEAFWRYSPAIPDGTGHGRRPKKDRAIAAWDRLRADDATIDRMAIALKHQKESRQWQEGIGIPYASTWLNARSWEEYEELPSNEAAPERKLVGERC